MNSNNTFAKLFNVRFSPDEWPVILEDWDGRVQWTVAREGKDSFFLHEWISSNTPPEKAIEWLLKKHGAELFTNNHGFPGSAFERLLLPICVKDDNGRTQALFIKNLDKETYVSAVENRLSVSQEGGILGRDNAVKGDTAVIYYLAQNSAYKAVDAYLEKYPQALYAAHNGVTVGSILGSTEEGWEVYLTHGGSPFDKVFTHPHTNAKVESNEAFPLWQWLMQKKIYHTGMRKTMSELLMRLQEGREAKEGDYVLSNDDWKQLVDNKKHIMREINMLEFEINIKTDWKSAIKSNKSWRSWRSSEGANFIFWLCSKVPSEFVRQAHKTKLNTPLMQQTDHLGRNFVHYLLTGMLTANLGSYRRANKVKNELWQAMLSNLKDIFPQHPSKGILADWVTSDQRAYFGTVYPNNLGNHYDNNYLTNFLNKNPDYFWKGFKGEAISKVFESNSSGDRVVALFKSLGGGMNKESCEKFLNSLDQIDRFRFGVIISANGIKNYLQTDARQIFENCWEDVLNTPIEILELGEVQQMAHFFKKRNSDWRITEEARSVQTFLDKAILQLSIRSNSTEATQDNSKKRRM